MYSTWDKINHVAEENGGYLTTKQTEESGISRPMLTRFVKSGKLVRVCRGHYILAASVPDEFALLQSRSSRLIFSYGTALFLWGLTDRVPHLLDVTVPQGMNTTAIRRDNEAVRFHYVQPNLLDFGKTETVSPQGNRIALYDKERCVCDLIRARKSTDMQIYSQTIKGYFAGEVNVRQLLKYGKQFGIEDKIRIYMEVLL